VFFCFLLDVADLLGYLLEAILVVGVLYLQLWIQSLVNVSANLAKILDMTDLAASFA